MIEFAPILRCFLCFFISLQEIGFASALFNESGYFKYLDYFSPWQNASKLALCSFGLTK